MKSAKVYMHDNLAGILTEDDEGFHFQYDSQYLESDDAEAISLTIPLKEDNRLWGAQLQQAFLKNNLPTLMQLIDSLIGITLSSWSMSSRCMRNLFANTNKTEKKHWRNKRNKNKGQKQVQIEV